MPRVHWRPYAFIGCFGAYALASTGSTTDPAALHGGVKILEVDPFRPADLVFGDATGDSFHLTAPNPPTLSTSSIKVTENSLVIVPNIEAQAGAAWFNPNTGRLTTVHWEVLVEGNPSDSGTLVRRGVPTPAEWDDFHGDEGDYPYGDQELTNDHLKLTFDLVGEAEAFHEGNNHIWVRLWGSTYVWRSGWTPDDFRHSPTEKKSFQETFSPDAAITVGVPYSVWKDPIFDEITKPHVATLTVDLWDRNEARSAFRGNVQEFELPRVRILHPNGVILPDNELVVASDTRTHTGTHPPPTVHVTPDFAPIEVEIYHRQWDLRKNRGREYHRSVVLRPTVLHCILDGPPVELPPTPPEPPAGELPAGKVTPRRGAHSPGGQIQPPGEDPSPIEGSVRLDIVSLLYGNPTLEFDASADADGEWRCGECLESGDQVELRYTYRDIFGRHFADTIPLTVPDSLDLLAPQTLEVRQPLLVVVETEQSPDPSLEVQIRVLDLGSAPFGVLRPLSGIAIADVMGGATGTSNADGAFDFDVPHGALVRVSATHPLGRYLPLLMPVTPPLETHLSHREVGPGSWQDDRLFLWLTPSFSDGRLHLGSGRIDGDAGGLRSRIGAVSNIAPQDVLSARWESADGLDVGPAAIRPWGQSPRADLGYVPALFALAPFGDAGNEDPVYQAALWSIMASGGARLRVVTSDLLEHVLEIPLEAGQVTSTEDWSRSGGLALHVAPNPFNPATSLSFELPANAHVRLTILGVDGRHVRTLFDGRRNAGRQLLTWNGRDERGITVASGTYFARLEVGSRTAIAKLTVFK